MFTKHAVLRSLFRANPGLALTLLRCRDDVTLPEGCTPCSGDPVLALGDPTLEADAVTLLRDGAGVTRFGIVVDLVTYDDAAKKRRWAVHGDALREREGVECVALVLAVTDALAAWAKAPAKRQIWMPRAKPGHIWTRTSGSDG